MSSQGLELPFVQNDLFRNNFVRLDELFELNYEYFYYGYLNNIDSNPKILDDINYYINAILGGIIKILFDQNIGFIASDLSSRLKNKEINSKNVKFAKTFIDYVEGGDRWKKYQLVIPYMELEGFKLKKDSIFSCEKMKIAISLDDDISYKNIYNDLLDQVIEFINNAYINKSIKLIYKNHKPSKAHPDGYLLDYIHVIGEYPNFHLKPNEANKIAITVSNLFKSFPTCEELLLSSVFIE